jgi:hypothetical protein|uniref:Stage III sporulation protein AC n=1 Tax=Myoviridae sp. ctYA416 TaxID=2825125 RepID=A0A8S5UTS5_9CAUD|nr:MAG TPA: hypothetical protein [Myoviridae sp. ctYA416]
MELSALNIAKIIFGIVVAIIVWIITHKDDHSHGLFWVLWVMLILTIAEMIRETLEALWGIL